jgi:riboflavin kinase / FMN adenylyltransferase
LFVQHFDMGFAQVSAESFVSEILIGAVGASHVIVGRDCTFGNRRRGTSEMLVAAGWEHGFAVTILDPVRGTDEAVYSATHIRELLRQGKPREAAAQLGRFWEIDGRVMEGDRRGRTIGFPTVNLGLDDYLRPAFGVYAVRVSGDGPDDPFRGRAVDGVANLGLRPTIGTPEPRLEAHLFDIDADLYHRHLRVSLVDFIRPEQKFSGLDALKAQIAADAQKAREILASQSHD